MTNSVKNLLVHKHGYHLVDPSPWPIFTSFSSFIFLVGVVLYLHSYKNGGLILLVGLFLLLYAMICWWRDVVRESTFEGHHTKVVQLGLRYGIVWFIISEICFFAAIFWAFFHSSLAPTIDIGTIWPPQGIEVLNPWHIPFLNTLILLLSGCSVTWSHHAIMHGFRKESIISLLITVILAVIFTSLQAFEYINANFNISDGIYGATFYLGTGFHGLHVMIGTIFLFVCLLRVIKHHFASDHHFGFEAAAWYWHMVDFIWLILFISVYWWGGN